MLQRLHLEEHRVRHLKAPPSSTSKFFSACAIFFPCLQFLRMRNVTTGFDLTLTRCVFNRASARQNSLYLQHKFWALSLSWTGFRLHTGLYMNIIMWEEIHTVFTWFFFVLGQCLKYRVKCMKGGINFMWV